MDILIESFGFKHGASKRDMIVDVRSLPNPHSDPALRALSGLDADVQAFFAKRPSVEAEAARIAEMIKARARQPSLDSESLPSLGIGCVGGRHRSVHVAQRVAALLSEAGIGSTIRHREMELPPQPSPRPSK